MTAIQCQFYDSEENPLVGYVLVRLANDLQKSSNDATHLPVSAKEALVNGACTLNLEPSDLAKVTYLIEVYQQSVVSVPDENGNPVNVTVDTKIGDGYHIIVPYSATPIKFESLTRKTGIDRDRTDTMISAVIRRMATSPDFWALMQQELFPFKGEYSSSVYYRRGNLVSYGGSGWICIAEQPIIGITPVSGANWGLWVSKGDTGSGTTGDDTAYDATSWDGSLTAPSKNAVRDMRESLVATLTSSFVTVNSPAFTGSPTLVTAPLTTDRSSKLVTSQWVGTLYSDAKNSGMRVGMLILYPAASRPLGFIKCGTGATLDVSQTTYSALFAVYGTIFGSSTSGNFRLPSASQLPSLPSATLSWYVFTGRND